jgi:hypothetical protein
MNENENEGGFGLDENMFKASQHQKLFLWALSFFAFGLWFHNARNFDSQILCSKALFSAPVF